MPKILFLIPDLSYSETYFRILAKLRTLPAQQQVHVVALRNRGPVQPWLEKLGVQVTSLSHHNHLDLWILPRLFEILTNVDPDEIHAFRPITLRHLLCIRQKFAMPLHLHELVRVTAKKRKINRLDLYLSSFATKIIVETEAEWQFCLQQGISHTQLSLQRPSIPTASFSGQFGSRVIGCLAELEEAYGVFEAIWGFDILRQIDPDLQLRIIGNGSELPRLQRFIAKLDLHNNVHISSGTANLSDFFQKCTMLWVPSKGDCGLHAALNSMAHGVPVVATAVPCLRELLNDGENGMLVPTTTLCDFAKRALKLLEQPQLWDKLARGGYATLENYHQKQIRTKAFSRAA